MRNLATFLKPVLASAFAASVLFGAALPASAAAPRNVVIAADGAAVTHKVVHQGSIIRLAQHDDSVNDVSVVRVKSKHHVLRLVTSYDKLLNWKDAFPEGKTAAALGFSKQLKPIGEVYKAVKPGKALIVTEETRPSLGGIHAHFWHKIYVRVTR